MMMIVKITVRRYDDDDDYSLFFKNKDLPHLLCLTTATGVAVIHAIRLASHSLGYVLPSLPHTGRFLLSRHSGH